MSVLSPERILIVAKASKPKPPPEDADEPRDRIDLRIDPALYARIKAAALRVLGEPNMSAYIRMAVLERLAKDDAPKAPAR